MSNRFHHLHLICSDLEAMRAFLCQELGARLIKLRKFGDADGAELELGGVGVNLRVARDEEGRLDDASRTRLGYHHLGVEVQDVDAEYARLTAKGYASVAPVKEAAGVRFGFIRGPDQIVVELVQRIGPA
jgi:catechol 2,3-dioxygenase-like lactoylglutathione lyase family enzyme